MSLIDGRVGLRQVDQGNYVQPSDANGVAIITRTKPITIIFTLPENRVQPVLVRLRSGAKLAAVAYDHSRSEKIAEGEVFAIDNQIDPATGTVKLRASFANDDEHLYPSQFVNVELHVDTLHDVVLAPQAAVQHGAQGPFVYAIKPDNSVAVRPVKLGAGSDERVVVTQGLDGGERVVVEGSDKLREGSGIVTASTEGPGGARAGSDEKSGAREQRHEDGGRDGSGKHARPIAAQAQ